jgi:hypothetical protein
MNTGGGGGPPLKISKRASKNFGGAANCKIFLEDEKVFKDFLQNFELFQY